MGVTYKEGTVAAKTPEPADKPTGGLARLMSIGDEKLSILHNRLSNGDSAQSLAQMMRGEWSLFADVAEGTLAKSLLRYKDKFVTGKLPTEKRFEEKLERAASFDTLAEMERLYKLQMTRINMAHERENNAKMLLPMVGNEVTRARDMLTAIQRVRFELGLDAYCGQVVQQGKVTRTVTQNPDGGSTVTEVKEATQVAMSILDKYAVTPNE